MSVSEQLDISVSHADGIVVDIGGTTTDVGLLQQGFPRPTCTGALLAGVRINQRVPDILSIGTSTQGSFTVLPLPLPPHLLFPALPHFENTNMSQPNIHA